MYRNQMKSYLTKDFILFPLPQSTFVYHLKSFQNKYETLKSILIISAITIYYFLEFSRIQSL